MVPILFLTSICIEALPVVHIFLIYTESVLQTLLILELLLHSTCTLTEYMNLFQTVQWDMQKWFELTNATDPSENGMNHMDDRITDIQNKIKHNIERKKLVNPLPINIGLRTEVWMERGGAVVQAFNDVVR